MGVELHLVMGPMFAGKTTYLLNKVNDLLSLNIISDDIFLINHSSDSRYDINKIYSHNGLHYNATSLSQLSDILDILKLKPNIKYIFIDEAQFFNDLYNTIISILLANAQQNEFPLLECIYLFGLDSDFKQEPFYNSKMLDLIPYSNTINKLLAKCTICQDPAMCTKRINTSKEQILVGGLNDYQPRCIKHL